MKNFKDFFPIFKKDKGVRLVYLDSSSTAQKPECVVSALSGFYQEHNAQVHRSGYEIADSATAVYENCREKIAAFIGAKNSRECIFTSGATEGINLVAESWARPNLNPGDEVLITIAEHHSNFLPWQRLCQETGAKLIFLLVDKKTFLIEESWQSKISDKTKLVAVAHESNVLGDVWPQETLNKFVSAAHFAGARVLIDAAQSAPHRKIDVEELDADFLVFSGHKMFGPTGIGVLFIKHELHDSMKPYKLGGSMVKRASIEKSDWQACPQKFEAGTPPIAQAVGLAAAVDFYSKNIDYSLLADHEGNLCSMIIDGLLKIDGVEVLANADRNIFGRHIVSFSVQGAHPHDISTLLGQKNICVRAGNHCAQPLAEFLGVTVSLRASTQAYNSEKDVEIFLKELEKVIKQLRQL